jgi:hypothetical protein
MVARALRHIAFSKVGIELYPLLCKLTWLPPEEAYPGFPNRNLLLSENRLGLDF